VTGKRVRVHTVQHARAALAAASELGKPVTLISAKGAAATLGAGYFRKMIDAARADFPDAAAEAILDCGDDPGYALAALQEGMEAIRVDAPVDVRRKIDDIAVQCGARLDTDDDDALDLLDIVDAEAAARDWLADD